MDITPANRRRKSGATYSFYEFFAGGGMARAGLGNQWRCLFANDFDHKKAVTYRSNWGDGEFVLQDVGLLNAADLPGAADLVWGSFPCQDLSLAGNGAGLDGTRSGTFWPFLGLVRRLRTEGRSPSLVVLENVYGTLRSHAGKDFQAICKELSDAGFRLGAMIVDAALFVPQSRPRLFVVAVDHSVSVPQQLVSAGASHCWHPKALREGWTRLSKSEKDRWIWWNLAEPRERLVGLTDIIEDSPSDVEWHTTDQTARLLSMMSPVHLKKVKEAKLTRRRMVGTIYKRTRESTGGERVQRAEVRFDELSGCLRTPAGGSSRQIILVVEGDRVRSRLISARETARLMGLPDSYKLPSGYNDAYHLTGDGVVVPVVRHLARHLLEPILNANRARNPVAA